MRAIWKGAVSFGLVSIGVKLFSATEEKDIRFHQVHLADGGRIKYKRICSTCGGEVSYDDIAKGYDLGGGDLVILTDEDFAGLPLSTSRAIDVLQFVPAEQVDTILYDKAYYLEPEAIATKPYLLLRDALSASHRVALVKVALRQREQLATLRVREGVLVLNTMLWPDEVRAASFDFLDSDVRVRPQELVMATSLVESMAADFKPEEFHDGYREALQAVIDAKASGRQVVTPPEAEPAPSAAVDLMAALRASVERARAARDGSSLTEVELPADTPVAAPAATPATASTAAPADDEPPAEAPAAKQPPRKQPAKKQPAKKAAAGRSTTSTGTSTTKRASATKSRRSA